ncbi:SRPBCC family protein [Kangiella sp. M94]
MQDKIEREIIINAPKERIYEAIADPKKVVQWFPETLEGSYQVGESPIFGFGEHGKNQVYIVDAKPHEYFAYRWVPGSNHFTGDVLSVPNTLVEFRISESGNGCKVTLTETGFSKLPAEVAEESLKQNTGGWEFMLDRLQKLFAE